MQNQKNIFSIKGIGISLVVALLAMGTDALAGKKNKKNKKGTKVLVWGAPSASAQNNSTTTSQTPSPAQCNTAPNITQKDIETLFEAAALLDGQRDIQFGKKTYRMPQEPLHKLGLDKKLQSYLTLLRTKHWNMLNTTSLSSQETCDKAVEACCGSGKDERFKAVCAFAKHKYKAIIKASTPADKQKAKQQYTIIATALRHCFEDMTQTQRKMLLLSACYKTDFELIADLLLYEFAYIEKVKIPNINKLGMIKNLKKLLSDRYSVQKDNPDKKHALKERTLMHCILRNADGSEQKSLPLAPREDTVRALLMLIVAGANPNHVADKFVPKGAKTSVEGAKVAEIPNKSVNYLSSKDKKSKTGASFRCVNGIDIFDKPSSNQKKIVEALKKMCYLCAFVIGDPGKHEKQALYIREAILKIHPPKTKGPFKDKKITSDVTLLQHVLQKLKDININELLENLKTTHYCWNQDKLIKKKPADYLQQTPNRQP